MHDGRRSFLLRTGAVAGSITGLAGCSGQSGSTATESDTGTATDTSTGTAATTATDTATETATERRPALGDPPVSPVDAVGELPVATYLPPDNAFIAIDAAGVRAAESALPDAVYDAFTSTVRFESIPYADVDRQFRVGNSLVLTGSFDRAAFVEEITEASYESVTEQGTRSGFDLYWGESAFEDQEHTTAYAVTDETIVVTPGRIDSTVATLRTIVDTGSGDADRCHAVDDLCHTLLRWLGDGTFVAAEYHPDDYVGHVEANGTAWTVDGGTTTLRAVSKTAKPSTLAPEAIQTWTETAETFDRFDEVSVGRDGETVVLAGSLPTAEMTSTIQLPWQSTLTSRWTVDATFSFEYDADAGTLTIQHEGSRIPRRFVNLRGEGFRADASGVDQTAPGEWQGSTQNGGVIGTTVTVGVTADYAVEVTYEVGGETVVLGADSGPEA